MANRKKEYKEILIYVALWMIPFLFTLYALFVEEGLTTQEFLDKSMFYFIMALVSMFMIVTFKMGKAKFGDRFPLTAKAMIHDPEQGFLGKSKYARWISKPWNLFIICVLLFFTVSLIGAQTNTFFAQTPAEFQVTNTGKTILSVYPGSPAETDFFVVILILLLGVTFWLFKRNKWKMNFFAPVSLFVIPFIMGGLWMAFHMLRYGDSELNLFSTFLFGAGGSFFTVLTGSIIPWRIWHDANNFFFKLNELMSNEAVLVIAISTLILIGLVFFGIKALARKRTKSES
jgi:hypothetical protein